MSCEMIWETPNGRSKISLSLYIKTKIDICLNYYESIKSKG